MSAIVLCALGRSRPKATTRGHHPTAMGNRRPRRAGRLGVLPMIGAIAALLAASASVEAAAITHSSTGPALGIPDNGYDGTLDPGTVASSTITIDPFPDHLIEQFEITVAIDHAHVGDLTLELEGPAGSHTFLVNRPGLPLVSSPGASGGGDSSTLRADTPITFSDHAPGHMPADLMGAFIGQDDIVGAPASPNNPDHYLPSAGLLDTRDFASLAGMSLVGDWTLHVGDSTPGGTGSLESWSITAVTMPAPGAATAGLVLMTGIVGAGLIRRPRHRRAGAGEAAA